jgi:recombinational DNA repair protein (RecF pathway)
MESSEDRCGKCGAEIDPNRRVDFTLKDGTRVCESCFVKGTARPTQKERGGV